MTNNHYHSFIHEAFIKPIRSVLIVDDDYPTYDDVLNLGQPAEDPARAEPKKAFRENPSRAAKVINGFRHGRQPMLVDIHDGANLSADEEVKTAQHLHQCDLLVLDFELDKAMRDDGTRAIEILRAVMSNAHFNLVVVYTVAELDKVFDDIRWGLVAPSKSLLDPEERKRAQELISQREDDDSGFEERISNTVGGAQYFHSRQNQSTYPGLMANGKEPYTLFHSEANNAGWNGGEMRLVLRYLLGCLEEKLGVSDDEPGRSKALQ